MVGRYLIHGIDYVGGNFQEVVDFIEDAHNDKAACLIGFAPMTSAAEAIRNKKFRDTLNGFDIVCMDGASIVKRAKGAHYCVPERCSGPDVMTEIIRRAAYMGTTHYLYGTNKETLQKLKKYLESEGAYVAGAMAPPFLTEKQWEACEWKDPFFYTAIKQCNPDYVWISLGAPKQEYFCMAAKNELPGTKLVAVGAAFNFLAGTVKRAPVSWQDAGLEWAWRMLHEPKQIWRYIKSAAICTGASIRQFENTKTGFGKRRA